jgi:hypothetical protein
MKKDQVLKTGSYNYNLGQKIAINLFILHITSSATGSLLYSLYARDVPYLKDQAS